MNIKIITVGKKHEPWISEGIEHYQKRLKSPFKIEWVFVGNSPHSGLRARQDESRAILKRVNANDYLILLDERGEMIDSMGLSALLLAKLEMSRQIVVIIGGAYGVDHNLTSRADYVWALSRLVLPHQMVRLILTEQIYRSQEIAAGGQYHHK